MQNIFGSPIVICQSVFLLIRLFHLCLFVRMSFCQVVVLSDCLFNLRLSVIVVMRRRETCPRSSSQGSLHFVVIVAQPLFTCRNLQLSKLCFSMISLDYWNTYAQSKQSTFFFAQKCQFQLTIVCILLMLVIMKIRIFIKGAT